MTQAFYIKLMSLIEILKHSGEKNRYKAVRAFRYYKYLIASQIANQLIKKVSIKSIQNKIDAETSITASLTTFPARVKEVRYAILSILLQTMRPNRVILWLAREQFPEEKIPENLTDLCQYGLEVHFCDDLRSHKKYYYALQEQKADEVVITFDDDIIYHPHTIERLMQKHKEHPECIVCSQVHVMTFNDQGEIMPYNQWSNYSSSMPNPNKDFMPLTGSGCLYPYNIMPKTTFQKDKLMKCAFTADDLWIGFMARISKVPICITDKPANIFSVVTSSQTQHLGQINCLGNGNDCTIQSLISTFGLPIN